MKRIKTIGMIIAAACAAVILTSCGKSEFKVTENTGKRMVIEAVNADKDAFFMTGSLEVGDGEQIEVSSDLKKGSIRVEIVRAPENQSIDKLPDLEGEPVITANLHSKDGGVGCVGTVSAGTYLVKATCLEKATGTVEIKAEPVS